MGRIEFGHIFDAKELGSADGILQAESEFVFRSDGGVPMDGGDTIVARAGVELGSKDISVC